MTDGAKLPGSQGLPRRTRTRRFRDILTAPDLAFIMEAHNGLSAKVVEEAGFEGIWASGLSMSAALGVRDNNEASWTQILEVLEFMADATSLPILVDGDTGHGNFNNVRRFVRKLCERGIAAVCIEDKQFPKTNSFLDTRQPLADIDEFCGRIKAGKDAQTDPDFTLVARLEALIAGWGLDEALRRGEAYRRAGADAILIHSKQSHANEILAFCKEWANRLPVVIVPTTYYSTPTRVFRDANIAMVIWANHNMRAALSGMREVSRRIKQEESLINIEGEVASIRDVFAITGNSELIEAEQIYLPAQEAPRGLLLAASRGSELGDLTADKPKCMLDIRGKPLLARLVGTLRDAGISEVGVVRGYRKEAIALPGIRTFDNDAYETSGEAASLACAIGQFKGPMLIGYADILTRKYVISHLLDTKGDIVIIVDGSAEKRQRRGKSDLVSCSRQFDGDLMDDAPATLVEFLPADASAGDGEWIGLIKTTAAGTEALASEIRTMADDGSLAQARLPDLLKRLMARQVEVRVAYISGHWLDVDTVYDLAKAREFR